MNLPQPVKKVFTPVLFLITAYLFTEYLPVLKKLNLQYNDLFHKISYVLLDKPEKGRDAVFILIDPKTDKGLKYQNPYPRGLVAEMLLKLNKFSPRMILMDYVFMGVSDKPEEDLLLAEVIRKTRPILFSYVQSDGSVYPVLELFAESAKGTGLASLTRDSDGVHRSVRPFYFDASSMKQYFCVLMLAALDYYGLPFNLIEQDFASNSLRVKKSGSQLKPLYYGKDCRLEFRNYYRFADIKKFSFIDVYENRIDPGVFRDKIVFFGRESNIFHDIHETPLGSELGCIIIYNIFLTFINNAFPERLNHFYNFLLFILPVLLAFSLITRSSIFKKRAFTLFMLMAVFLIQLMLFYLNFSWNGFIPFAAILVMALVREVYFYILNFREIHKIKKLMIINPVTRLVYFNYFTARLGSMVSDNDIYDESYYTGAVYVVRSGTNPDLSETDLIHIAGLFNINIRYRELLSWDSERKNFYFILRGERPAAVEKRLKESFYKPAFNYLAGFDSGGKVSILFVPVKTVSGLSMRAFFDALDRDLKSLPDSRILFMQNCNSLHLNYHGINDENFNETEYVLAELQKAINLNEKLRLTEKEIKLSNKLAGVGKIAAQVAHELKNPLGNILNMKSWFEETIPPNHPARECINALEQETLRLQRVCRQILQFSRPSSNEKQLIQINELLEDTLRFLAMTLKKNSVILKVNLDKNMCRLYLNGGQIKQVFMNIILNAVDAMKKGGFLYVSTFFEPTAAEIVFEDTGIGIPPENMDKIFDLFYTTKGEQGTGLGLSISLDIVKQHDGRLVISSEYGRGTRVSIVLPV